MQLASEPATYDVYDADENGDFEIGVRTGLEAFFRHRGFLDHVRTRPIPHEGFHANAGYFYFFGHYYAARVIELLPREEREAYRARLRPHLCKTQWASGALHRVVRHARNVTDCGRLPGHRGATHPDARHLPALRTHRPHPFCTGGVPLGYTLRCYKAPDKIFFL